LKGKTPFKVAILGLTIHSPENLGYMQEGLVDMLTSRVELQGRVEVLEKSAVKKVLADNPGEIDTEQARKIGQQLEADFVVYGSLTKLGDSASLDLKLVEVKEEKPGSSIFVQSRKMEEIITRVDDLARKVDEKILGYSLTPPVEQAAIAEKPAEAPRSMAMIPVPPAATPAAPSAAPTPPPGFRPMTPARTDRGAMASEIWQSNPFSLKVKGMAIADFDGDGRNEVALIDDQNLWIYRWENEFKLLKKLSGKGSVEYLAVDAGDINKDGKARIFVTNMEGDRTGYGNRKLSSFVVAYKDGDYRVAASDLEWYLSVVNWGERGAVLLGQKKGLRTGFEGPIYEMGWNGKGYKDIRKIQPSKVFSLYGFTPFVHEGKTFYAFIDSDLRLKVLDQRGSTIWRSRTDYGSDNSFRVKPMPTSGPGYDTGEEMAHVNVRVIARGNEVLILRNISILGNFLKRQQSFSGGEVQALSWNGAMMTETWKSPEISGYLADFQVQNLDGAPGTQLVVAVILASESIFSGAGNSALLVSRMQ
jgi:TolB-like protein